MEKDDLKAEGLHDVTCVLDDGEELLKPVWDKNSMLKAVKVSSNACVAVLRSSICLRCGIGLLPIPII